MYTLIFASSNLFSFFETIIPAPVVVSFCDTPTPHPPHTKVDEAYAPDFVVRTFRVENEEGKSRKLTHFQYVWLASVVCDGIVANVLSLCFQRYSLRRKQMQQHMRTYDSLIMCHDCTAVVIRTLLPV